MVRKKAWILSRFLLFFMGILTAQQFQFKPHLYGTNLFAGGIDTPRYQLIDIDGDGDRDLFIVDRDETLWFYRCHNNQFVLEPSRTFGLTVGSWFHFTDIDQDGDYDCFTNGEFSDVQLRTNIGSAFLPQFQKNEFSIKDTAGNELFSERFSIPTFADIDGDGDADFFSGSQSGSITHYENVGTSTAPAFAFITSEFNGIKIIGGGLKKPQHGASGIEFFDADSNGTLDLFWGDYFNPSMYVLKNIGNSTTPNFTLTDSTYPKENPIVTSGFNIPQHVDIDRDGVTDLVAGTVFPTEGYDNLWYYRNKGSNSSPFYELQAKNLVSMIDVGGRSTAAVIDVDADGDQDLCVSSAEGKIHYFRNTGTPSLPQFSTLSSGTIDLGTFFTAIASADLDGDGKEDILAGDFSGTIRFLKNTGTGESFEFSPHPFPLDTVDVGNSAAPCVADIDHDGMPDILIGNSGGILAFYRNNGTNVSPEYSLISTHFGNIDVGNDAIPTVCDFDGNGRNDLFIGNSEGRIAHYQYNPPAGSYDSVTAAFEGIEAKVNTAPAFADINDDGDMDLLLGNGKGGIYFYENTAVLGADRGYRTVPSAHFLFQNYPNPFNDKTTITFSLETDAFVNLKIYSILGVEIERLLEGVLRIGRHSVSWDAAPFSAGIYFYRLTVLSRSQQQTVLTRSMIYLK